MSGSVDTEPAGASGDACGSAPSDADSISQRIASLRAEADAARAAADAIDVDAEVARALRRSKEHEARSLSDSCGDSERAIGTASLARERFAANVLSEGRSLDESVDAFE